MNHRTSVHFSEFMQAAGQCLADDVFLDEYKTLYPQKVGYYCPQTCVNIIYSPIG